MSNYLLNCRQNCLKITNLNKVLNIKQTVMIYLCLKFNNNNNEEINIRKIFHSLYYRKFLNKKMFGKSCPIFNIKFYFVNKHYKYMHTHMSHNHTWLMDRWGSNWFRWTLQKPQKPKAQNSILLEFNFVCKGFIAICCESNKCNACALSSALSHFTNKNTNIEEITCYGIALYNIIRQIE